MFIRNVIKISALLCLLTIFGNILDVTCFSDFENLSYGKDVLSGVAPAYSVTPAPPVEVTTKKSGFFSGIKNFFSRSSTETSKETTNPTTTSVITPKPSANSIPVQSPLSPKGQNTFNPPTGGANPPIGGGSLSSRDYVNPNVKPGTNPVRPPNEQTPLAGNVNTFNPPTGVSNSPIGGGSSSSRDYVNPNVKPGTNPVRPPNEQTPLAGNVNTFNPPTGVSNPPIGGGSSSSRDYVNPNVKPGTNPVRPPNEQTPLAGNVNNFNPPTGVSNPPIGGGSSSSRDYVNPNVKPGTNPVRPPNEQTLLAGNINGPIGQAGQSSRRDYVNPNPNGPLNGDTSIPVRPPIAGPVLNPGSNPAINPKPTSPSNRRDYVAPIRPAAPNHGGGMNFPQGTPSTSTTTTILPIQPNSRRDYVNPNIPTPKLPVPILPNQPNINQPTPSPAIHPANTGGRRDYVNPNTGGQTNLLNANDFPALPTPKKPPTKEDFPTLPPPRRAPGQPSPNPSAQPPNSALSKPGVQPDQNRVSFVPHQPKPASTGNIAGGSAGGAKNQLASDEEISTLTENLLSKDTNNQNKHITLNLQGKTRSTERTDEAPNKLMEINEVALESPTIAKMRLLFNNYELDTLVNEHVTPIERKEENDFLDAVMTTTVMRQAMSFLQNKGLLTPDPKTHRDLLKTIWFTMYSRGQGRIGSSAFEHVFLTEVKNGSVIGLHNWVYFYEEEKAGHIDYKGYIKKIDLGNKGSILKYRFDLNNLHKPVNTLFIGTSPELELALYTVCFQLRPDKDCPITLNGNKINIVTHTWRYRGKSLIGSAFPEI